jgi:DNA mismatch repair ATPase MutL
VIDKARAEIEKLQTYKMFVGEDTVYIERDDVLAIIDKHKAEREINYECKTDKEAPEKADK